MEAFSSQDDVVVDRACVCDSLFAILDIDKQQQQLDTTTTTARLIAIPPTNTKNRPPKTRIPINTHTNANTNTNKKKKKKKKEGIPSTRTPLKTTHKIKRLIVKMKEVKQYLQHVQNNPDLDQPQPKTHTDKDTINTTEFNNNNNNNTNNGNPTKADDNHILGPSNHFLFTATERVVPIEYPIKITEQTAIDKLLVIEHNELLKQGIRNLPEFTK